MKIPDPSLLPAAPPPTDFFEMLATLSKWQSSLFAHLDSIQTVDCLTQLLESGDKLQLYRVSDGGAKGNLGYFGWELAIG